jgi:5-methylcytosine-specific restriction endonuclease McrA
MKKWEKFSKEEIEQFVKERYSYRQLGAKIGYNPNGGSLVKTMVEMVDKLQLDVSHFKGPGWNKENYQYERFQKGKTIKNGGALKAIIALRGHQCECCKCKDWLDNPIPLEVHHIDGDRLNNELSNLQLLCPNCHALTDNYRGRNITNKKRTETISEEDFVEALRTSPNIRQALLKLGLSAKGGNYQRANELIIKYQITHLL